ncbi:hypothetical protein ACFO4P_04140 [Epilithonimonas pallida]|uniref:Uncharacterized protein n=1 Tax=Epilithonimonas pallida TaxID=373671 RepID=A0ABY1R1M1_9FLAO|nr:hypothetical protein [Epilithonimonas pallida]SMP90544.1 hypothetical protein SAMN05421679_102366 [Epilithonimonas pallida]
MKFEEKVSNLAILLIIALYSDLLSAQLIVPNDYLKIPDSLYFKDKLYKSIIPSKRYCSWKVIRKDIYSRSELIYERNKDTCSKEKFSVDDGFFGECQPDGCFTYIVACRNKKLQYFTSGNQLISFIGYVDNLSEALLIARTYNLLLDRKNLIGGSFKIEKDYIYLYLAKFESCPVSNESFYVKINRKTGELHQESKGVYYKTDNCYTS